jgi:Acyl-CoA dehydrogenase, C-terminal domain
MSTALAAGLAAQAQEARATAGCAGLAAGLRVVVGAGQPVPCSASGRTLLPSGCAGAVGGWRLGSSVILAGDAIVTVSRHPLAAAEDIDLVRVEPQPRTPPETAWAASPDRLPALLLAVRLGLASRMLARAVQHLSGRQSGGRPLLDRQLLQGAIADAAATIEFCQDGLAVSLDLPGSRPALTASLHARLDSLDWSVATMFGASGYLRDHEVRCLYVAHLVHDAWADPGTGSGHAWEQSWR